MDQVNVINTGGRRRRVSWGSIIGGMVTVLAVSFLLSLIGWAIGLFMYDPMDSKPFWGMGTSVTIWTALSLLVSLAAGGFVAGKLAVRDGFIHGFLTWAMSLLVAIVLGAMMISSAAKMAGRMLGAATQVTGHVLSDMGSAVSHGTSDAASYFENLDLDINRNEMRQEVRQALRQSGIREFQPEYINGQLSAVRSDLKRSVKQLALNPKRGDAIISGFGERLQGRIDKYSSNIDREKAITAVANGANVSRAQAESTVDQYMALLQEGREKLDNLQQEISEARRDWEQMKQEALRKSEEMANSAAWSAIWSFLALLVGAAVAGFAGWFGAEKTKEGYEA